MSWSNWIYLGVGLGLGLGSRWLFESKPVSPAPLNNLEIKSQNQQLILPPKDVNQDVPALLQQLKQTQLAYQLAHEMSQFKAGFLVRVSHELRSPLNSLIGLHQLILSDLCDDPAEEREFVAQAHESALRLINLIDEILSVARIEHSSNQLEIQPLELASVLEEVYNLTHLLAANSNFTIELSLPEPEIYILADPRGLRQILVNLVDTCIAQMDEGSIYISAQPIPEDESVHIWLDVPLPASAWSEPINLMVSEPKSSEPIKEDIAPSPGMTLLLNQTLLELMKGHLEIVSTLTDTAESNFTRIQLTIPLVIPETASLVH
jgi:hypothetical protein